MEPAMKNLLEVLKTEGEKLSKVITDVSKCQNDEEMAQLGTEFLKNVSGSVSRCVELVDPDNISSVIEEVKKARASQNTASAPPSTSSANVNESSTVERTEENVKEKEEKGESSFKIGELVSLFGNFFEGDGGFEQSLKKSQTKWLVTQYKLLEDGLEKLKVQVKNLPENERNEFWCEYHGIKFQPTPQEERLNNIESKIQEVLSRLSSNSK